MKMNELKMNKLKKEMKNPSIISPTERFSEMNNWFLILRILDSDVKSLNSI